MSRATDWLRQAINEAKSRYTWQLNTAQINFGINVCEFLRHKRWTQDELASRMGVTQPWVSRHINGASYPTLDSLAKYAHAFGVEISDLVGEPKLYPPYPIFNDEGEQIGSYTTTSEAITFERQVEWSV